MVSAAKTTAAAIASDTTGGRVKAMEQGLLNEVETVLDVAFDQWLDVRKMAEEWAYRQFIGRAHHYLSSNSLPRNRLEWYAMMQHYGAPTRLLDWTYSPYIAAYFAVEDAVSNCAVWAIDGAWCKRKGIEALKETAERSDVIFPESNEGFELIVSKSVNGVYHVVPEHQNERLTIQQGLFLALGNPKKTFEENLMSYDEGDLKQRVYRFVIPPELRGQVLYDLQRMNISRATLFPGLDGFAQSIKNELFIQGDSHFAGSQFDLVRRSGQQFVNNLAGLFEAVLSPDTKIKMDQVLTEMLRERFSTSQSNGGDESA